jgi:ubiquinol-cytochrome c reductase cytochrome c subunit
MMARPVRGSGGGPKRTLAFLALFGIFLLPAALFLVVASPGGSGSADAATRRVLAQGAQADLVNAGRTLFLERCSSCHGASAQGTSQAPDILGLGAASYYFQMSTGRMPLAAPGTQGISKPPALSTDQIDAVIAYLTSLNPGGVPIPNVDVAAGHLSIGNQIFLLNCAPCHSSSGNGGSVGTQVAPNLHHATPTQIGAAVRVGPGTMPVFDTKTISDEQLNSLVRYVIYLRTPESPGGLDLGLYGPIVEGFVAVVIGLAAMVLVSRYIGARS